MTHDAIFNLFSLGVVTNRDEWVYADTEDEIAEKIELFVDIYNRERKRLLPQLVKGKLTKDDVADSVDYTIKWTRAVKNDLMKAVKYEFEPNDVIDCLQRPFVKRKLYFNRHLNEVQYQMPSIFPNATAENIVIAVNVGNKPFNVLASKYLVDLHFNGDSQCFPLYRYDKHGNRLDNITDWGLKRFREHYGDGSISRENIFHYTYGVLHDPAYRKKYELNLKREFPHIPFYDDFAQWAAWGERLMDLHLNYETVQEPYDRWGASRRSPTHFQGAWLKNP